jgi:predicted Rossmann fold nucleotide-binding protein DprA/Smf involved in DNA uptake
MKIAVFCSNQCPGDRILAAYDWARSIRENPALTIISGFHTVIEKDILDILLRGTCQLVIVPARSVEGIRVPAAWKAAIAAGRLRLESPFSPAHRRINRANALLRNQYVAEQADRIVIIHATPGGTLASQAEAWRKHSRTVMMLAELWPGE